VSDRLDEFGDAAVMLITFTRPRNLHGFRRQLNLSYPVLADETRVAYRAYELGRGGWRQVWGLQTLRAYRRLLRSGQRLRVPTQDTRQLGGDFVVDRAGLVAYTYRSRRPDDRPTVDDLIAAVRDAD
jgi:peroxiredoxin